MMSRTAQPSPWSHRRDRDKEREIKREAVLRVAAQLFNEKGFHATSLDEVAERLHVTKPTLYYYVKNKDEILFECVRIGLEMMQAAIAEAGKSGGTAMDKLIAAMRQYALIVTMDFGMCLIRVGEDPLPPESRRRLRGLKAKIDREFRALIEQGIAEGSLQPYDPKIAAFTLAGALSWIGRWYRPDGPLRPEDIADQSIAVLMNGLFHRAPAPPPAKGAASSATGKGAAARSRRTGRSE
ncbi:MAG: TetR/AcrR family transcriptional regulator [Pseudomonadota bacterium]